MARRRSFRKRSRRTYRKRRVTRRRSRRSVRRIARRVVSRAAETKSQVSYNLGLNIYSSANASFPVNNIIAVGPNSTSCHIAQGVQNGYRIGNKITTRSLWMKGTLHPTQYDATTNPAVVPQQVRMVVFYDRQQPNLPPAPGSDFFQFGNVNMGFLNDLTDLWRPYNTDRYRILTQRTYKLGAAVHEGPGNNPSLSNSANNDFKLNINFRINLTKYYPKIVKFDENNLQPQTRSLFVFWYTCSSVGNAYAAAAMPAQVEYMFEYKYTDM